MWLVFVRNKGFRKLLLEAFFMQFSTVCLEISETIKYLSDWTATSYAEVTHLTPAENGQSALILSIVLQHLTPPVVSFLGLGAVSAAVMSSADSSVLATSSLFTRNVYKKVFRQKLRI